MTFKRILALGILPAVLIGWWVSPGRAFGDGYNPQAICVEAWRHPHSAFADDCRSHGWTVHREFIIGPKLVVRIDRDFTSCQWEDGSGNVPPPCSWNWWGHDDGNGYGLSYWVDPDRATHYVWPALPTGSGWRWMTAEEDKLYDATLHPKRWGRCVILETTDHTTVRCADGEHHKA